ncbi:MAG: divalent-cation tolerance protein CutA [Spirochaetes bacterium]|nr:divalent-cation tolerance protein CutA [Spirochaetota bacterium]
MNVTVILTTIDRKHEQHFSHHLVKERFAACIERFDVKTLYWWEGKLCDEHEVSLIIKTPRKMRAACIAEIERTHPYDCPQIIVLDGTVANKPYFNFLLHSVTAGP